MRLQRLALGLGMLLAACVSVSSAPLGDTVTTRQGVVHGKIEGGVRLFAGIPYAAPPIGPDRWRPPQPPLAWEGAREATTFGSRCMQAPGSPPGAPPPRETMSEDCLTLNLWTPANSVGERLPVMVWLHGGNFAGGGGSAIDGARLAKRGIIVVTLNYRLGALGFLAHPGLSKESPHGVSGNYGLMDEIAALQWVHGNIAMFGGDPARVTLAGQSAGGTGVADLMISPLARGLFHQAILQSAGLSLNGQMPLAAKERQGAMINPDIAVLRAMPATQIIASFPQPSAIRNGRHFYPNIDGYVVPQAPTPLIAAGKAPMPMPVMIGSTPGEGLFWPFDLPRTVAAYRNYVGGWFGSADAEAVLARYPAASDAEASKAAARLVTDFKIAEPTLRMARGLSKAAPVYLYRFSRVSPANRLAFGGAAHTTELPYVFDTLTLEPGRTEERDRVLAQEMADAWAQFVKTGNPNPAGSRQWPMFRTSDERLMEFGETTAAAPAGSGVPDFFADMPTLAEH